MNVAESNAEAGRAVRQLRVELSRLCSLRRFNKDIHWGIFEPELANEEIYVCPRNRSTLKSPLRSVVG